MGQPLVVSPTPRGRFVSISQWNKRLSSCASPGLRHCFQRVLEHSQRMNPLALRALQGMECKQVWRDPQLSAGLLHFALYGLNAHSGRFNKDETICLDPGFHHSLLGHTYQSSGVFVAKFTTSLFNSFQSAYPSTSCCFNFFFSFRADWDLIRPIFW